MARRAISQAEQAQLTLASLCPPPSPAKAKRRLRSNGERALDRSREEALAMFRARDFAKAEARHVVALHAMLHKEILGADEADLDAEVFLGAVSAAKKLCTEAFGGDVAELVEYVRWAWGREKQREARRRANEETNGFRLSWRWLFAARQTLTDYRVAQHRSRKSA